MHDKTSHSLWVEIALLCLLALLWGASYLFIKIAVSEIPPLTLIASRVSVAALFLVALLAWRKERLPSDARIWRMLLVQAFFNSIGAWTVLAWGQQYIGSGLASILNSTSPIFVFLFTALFTRHEAVSGIKLLGAALGLAGVILVTGTDALAGLGREVAGQLAALAGAILYACAAIYGRRFSALPPAATAAGTMIWASVTLIPASLVLDAPWTLRPSLSALLAALALGLFSTGIALSIYFRLVRTLGSMGVASQAYLRAGIGVLFGIVVLGETFTLADGIGLILAIAGVAAINIRR